MFEKLMEKALEYKNAYESENKAIMEEKNALAMAMQRADEAKHKAIVAGDRAAHKAACDDLEYCNGRLKMLRDKEASIMPADEYNAFIEKLRKANSAANAEVYKRMREVVELWKGCLEDMHRNDAQTSAIERTMRGALHSNMHKRQDSHLYRRMPFSIAHVFEDAFSAQMLDVLKRKGGE